MRRLLLAVLLAIAWAVPATAAPAFVQFRAAMGTSGATATTSAFASDTTVGNIIVVLLDDEYSTSGFGYTHTCSDNKSNSYTKVHDKSDYTGGSVGSTEVWWAPITTGGSSHTISCSMTDGGNIAIAAMEFSGIDASPFDQQNGQNAAATFSSGNVTTTTADQLLVGLVSYQTGNTSTSDSPWVDVTTQGNGSIIETRFAYRIVSSTGTYAYTGTVSSNERRAAVATFKGTGGGGGGGGATPKMLLMGVGE